MRVVTECVRAFEDPNPWDDEDLWVFEDPSVCDCEPPGPDRALASDLECARIQPWREDQPPQFGAAPTWEGPGGSS